jgi:hypothetical protein
MTARWSVGGINDLDGTCGRVRIERAGRADRSVEDDSLDIPTFLHQQTDRSFDRAARAIRSRATRHETTRVPRFIGGRRSDRFVWLTLAAHGGEMAVSPTVKVSARRAEPGTRSASAGAASAADDGADFAPSSRGVAVAPKRTVSWGCLAIHHLRGRDPAREVGDTGRHDDRPARGQVPLRCDSPDVPVEVASRLEERETARGHVVRDAGREGSAWRNDDRVARRLLVGERLAHDDPHTRIFRVEHRRPSW